MTEGKLGPANLIREPLVIFVVISMLIFLIDFLGDDQPEESFEPTPSGFSTTALTDIVIDENLLGALQEEFSWLHGREPTAAETKEMVEEWLSEEITFRHTLITGQHLNDGKIREHMIEKISLLWAGLPDDPTDDQVLQHYMDNIEFYYSEPKVSFIQVFFNELPENSEEVLARLNAGENIKGDLYWLGDHMDGYAESIMKTSFGGDFYLTLMNAPLDSWIGPLSSARGFHYVKVGERTKAAPLKFEEIYPRVRQSWLAAEQSRRIEEQVEILRPQFNVVREDGGDSDKE